MKVAGACGFAVCPQDLWRLLNDADLLRRCAPGCEELEETDAGRYSARLKIGIGAIKGTYRCELSIVDANPPNAYTLVVAGKGPLGSVSGRIRVTLALPPEGGTELTYDGDVDVGGVIASVGFPVLKSVADFQTKEFFEVMKREISGRLASHGADWP